MSAATLRFEDGRAWFLAPRGRRFGAAVVDGLLTGSITVGTQFALGYRPWTRDDHAPLLFSLTAGLVLTTLVLALTMWRTDGRTPGKAALGLRVVREVDAPIDLNYAMYREVAIKWALFGLLTLLPGALGSLGAIVGVVDAGWILRPEHRALHDIVAGSFVVEDPR